MNISPASFTRASTPRVIFTDLYPPFNKQALHSMAISPASFTHAYPPRTAKGTFFFFFFLFCFVFLFCFLPTAWIYMHCINNSSFYLSLCMPFMSSTAMMILVKNETCVKLKCTVFLYALELRMNDLRRANFLCTGLLSVHVFSWKAFKGNANEIMLRYECLNCT